MQPICVCGRLTAGLSLRLTLRLTLRLSLLSAVCLWIVLCAPVASAGHIRVSDGKHGYEGKVVSLSKSKCSLLDRQGKLIHLDVKSLKTFEKVSARYQPYSQSAFRQELQKEFPDYEVVGATHYLVVGPRGRASAFARLFDAIYRDVEQFYRVRGFRVRTPEVPLVAIVFGSQQEFVNYCVRDKVPPSPTLLGYYSLLSNRVALFDDGRRISKLQPAGDVLDRYQSILGASGISGDTANTIVHETTHQVGYNIGVHSRLGTTPLWLVEGLATVLEPDAMRSSRGRNLLSDRLNPERSHWFANVHRPKRRTGNLAMLVASDDYFHKHVLDSYSESWAFTFFLLENAARRQQLVKYIQAVNARDPQATYTARERLQDFQSAFGDISRLEVEFIRHMDRM